MRKFLYLILCLGLFATGSFALENMPPNVDPNGGAPKVTPPGFPTVGMLEQHMSEGIGDFVQVDRIWNDQGDIVRYYFNAKHIRNNMAEGHITVWFLEEYTPQGRDMTIHTYESQGFNASNLKDMKYKYYPVTLAYADDWQNPYESSFDYEYSVDPGGEVCDSNQKIITYVLPIKEFQKLKTEQMHFIKLGDELKKRYDLR